jgi:hypothetical protein
MRRAVVDTQSSNESDGAAMDALAVIFRYCVRTRGKNGQRNDVASETFVEVHDCQNVALSRRVPGGRVAFVAGLDVRFKSCDTHQNRCRNPARGLG